MTFLRKKRALCSREKGTWQNLGGLAPPAPPPVPTPLTTRPKIPRVDKSVLYHTVRKFKLLTTLTFVVRYPCMRSVYVGLQDDLVIIIAKLKHNKIFIPSYFGAIGLDIAQLNSRLNCSFSNFKIHSHYRSLLIFELINLPVL